MIHHMRVSEGKCSVFLSYSLADRAAAEEARQGLALAGVEVVDLESLPIGANIQDAVWHAMANSDAVVVILSREGAENSNVIVELGMAIAWKKPVFPVTRDNGSTRVPFSLAGREVYPMSRIDDVARAILASSSAELSGKEDEILRQLYLETGVPTDRLMADPDLLERFAEQFRKRTRKRITGERLLRKMLLARKLGHWPRIETAARKRRQQHQA